MEESLVVVLLLAVGSSESSQTTPRLASSLGIDLSSRRVGDFLSAREAEFSATFRAGFSDEGSKVSEVGWERGLWVKRVEEREKKTRELNELGRPVDKMRVG